LALVRLGFSLAERRPGHIPQVAIPLPVTESEQLPPGLEFAWAVAMREVDRQFEAVDKLDAKIGVLWGLISAAIIWLLKDVGGGSTTPINIEMLLNVSLATRGQLIALGFFGAGMIGFGIAFSFALAALYPRTVFIPVQLRSLVEGAERTANEIRYRYLEG